MPRLGLSSNTNFLGSRERKLRKAIGPIHQRKPTAESLVMTLPTATELIEAKLGDSVGHAQKPTKLGTVTIDNRDGLGAVPNNKNVGYLGFTVHMKPSDFLNLNPERGEDKGIGQVEKHIRSGGSIGSPFLSVDWDTDDKSGDLSSSGNWRVTGHEGRARMLALHNMQPDVAVPVHVFPSGGIRARHLGPHHTSARIHPDTSAKTGRVHTPAQVTHTPDHA